MNNTSSLRDNFPPFYNTNQPLGFHSIYMTLNIQTVGVVKSDIDNLLPSPNAIPNLLLSMAPLLLLLPPLLLETIINKCPPTLVGQLQSLLPPHLLLYHLLFHEQTGFTPTTSSRLMPLIVSDASKLSQKNKCREQLCFQSW